jgi:peptidyl-tRNA hydrolase
VVAPDDETLHVLHDKYRLIAGVALITDAARTVFKEPTLTCLGVGPIHEVDRDADLRDLKPLK